ncbi:hypothetical protein [Aquabacterium sp.]|uniref:hypothetical protein n=1 Tax=Aquabacterium sp. TaxID=1872578 RepID=UPI00199F2BE6|nr:hypothetical protein [Aquabacterium sp.]MBC7699463.1 hypothetical protein [Aquabacterium sp.]
MTLAKTMSGKLKVLLWLGVAQAWSVMGLYFYKFAPGNWFTLSSERDVWGQFGDYVGGMLNPMLSFLAFSGLIVTIVLQARQLDEARSRSRLDELQGLMSSVSTTIDSLLRSSPTLHRLKATQGMVETNLTLFNHIQTFGTAALKRSEKESDEYFGEVFTHLMADIGPLVTTLGLELNALAWTIERYEAEGGGSDLLEFYRFRNIAVIVWLKALGQLKSHSKVDKVFQPEQYKDSF